MARLSEIYYNIEDSRFVFTYGDLFFKFSSLFYQEKFIIDYPEFLKTETEKLNIKFRNTINADYMILLLLYKKIEKRGFFVLYKGCLLNKDITFNCVIE